MTSMEHWTKTDAKLIEHHYGRLNSARSAMIDKQSTFRGDTLRRLQAKRARNTAQHLGREKYLTDLLFDVSMISERAPRLSEDSEEDDKDSEEDSDDSD